jgi:hypothetical protein
MEPYLLKSIIGIIRLQETEPLPVIIDFYAVQKCLYLWKRIPKPKTYGVGIDLSWLESIFDTIDKSWLLWDCFS